MSKRRSATRRAVKRSAKRLAKRSAYKSRKTHLKSRGRTQRGGGMLDDVRNAAAAAAAAAKEKAEAAAAALNDKGQQFITQASSSLSAGKTLLNVGQSIANIIPKIINGVFSLMVMVYILSTIARNPKAFAGAAKEDLKKKLEDLKKRMADFVKDRPELESCIKTFETKVNPNDTSENALLLLPSEAPQQTNPNIGKAVIYYNDKTGYQGVIVGEIPRNEEYDDPMYLIWLNGSGYTMPKPVRQSQPVDNPEFRIVEDENNGEFANLSQYKYGQQTGTIDGARKYYGIVKPDSSVQVATGAPLPETTDPQTEPDLFALLKGQMQLFSQASDKKQFIVDAVNGYIAASKLRLERVTERVKDPDLERCIQSIKEALTQQIKSQVAELKSKLSEISDSTKIQEVFEEITGQGEVLKELRDRAGAFTKTAKDIQNTTNNLFNNVTNNLPSFGSRRS